MFICVEDVEESQVDGRVIVLSNFTSRVHVREVLLYKYGQREIFFKKKGNLFVIERSSGQKECLY